MHKIEVIVTERGLHIGYDEGNILLPWLWLNIAGTRMLIPGGRVETNDTNASRVAWYIKEVADFMPYMQSKLMSQAVFYMAERYKGVE